MELSLNNMQLVIAIIGAIVLMIPSIIAIIKKLRFRWIILISTILATLISVLLELYILISIVWGLEVYMILIDKKSSQGEN